jgi:DNA-binding LacI/PurR family transcriptional regulator
MAENKRVTIKEIAQEAGVSTQTVSRVINNRPNVNPATREHVQNVIDKRNYRPSKLARSLHNGRSHTIGVVSAHIDLHGSAQIVSGIDKQTDASDYAIILQLVRELDNIPVDTILSNLIGQHVDGIVWAPTPYISAHNQEIYRKLASLPIPVVVLGGEPLPNLTTVCVDDVEGGRLAAAHLIEQGYQTIGCITGKLLEYSARDRLAGWRSALKSVDLPHDESLTVESDWSPSGGACAMRQLLQQRPDLDALFISNDQMALGALTEIRAAGYDIPATMGIVGYDDFPGADFFMPALTTVFPDLQEAGRALVRALHCSIEQPSRCPASEKSTILSPTLIVRASSAKPDCDCA